MILKPQQQMTVNLKIILLMIQANGGGYYREFTKGPKFCDFDVVLKYHF